MQKTNGEIGVAAPCRNPGSSWDDNLPVDQTPPPDHEEFERVSASGLRAMKERWEKRRQNRLLQIERDRAANAE